MREWLESLSDVLDDLEENDGIVTASAGCRRKVVLDRVPPPAGISLFIRDVGTAGRFTVCLENGTSFEGLVVEAAPGLRSLLFDAPPSGFRQPRIVGPPHEGSVRSFSAIELEAAGSGRALPEAMTLARGDFLLHPYAPPKLIELDAACLHRPKSRGRYRTIEVRGRCSLPTASRVNTLILHDRCSITAQGDLHVAEIITPATGVHFELSGTLIVPNLPPRTTVNLREGRLEVPAKVTVHSMEVRGSGSVAVEGAIRNAIFSPSAHRAIGLELYGSAEGIRGTVELTAHPDSVLIGSPESPLGVERIRKAAEADIQDVSLYGLKALGDLAQLEDVARLSLWIPRRAKERAELANDMSLGGGPSDTVARRKAQFWSRLATILARTHATGNVQSEARLQAMRWRRRSCPAGRERALLILYSLVGYGEKILRPVVCLLALCAATTPFIMSPSPTSLCCARAAEFRDAFLSLLLSPLAFFKSPVRAATVNGALDTVILVTFQLSALVLLFFTISAIRRVAKPEGT